jgi:hypothetical protein
MSIVCENDNSFRIDSEGFKPAAISAFAGNPDKDPRSEKLLFKGSLLGDDARWRQSQSRRHLNSQSAEERLRVRRQQSAPLLAALEARGSRSASVAEPIDYMQLRGIGLPGSSMMAGCA